MKYKLALIIVFLSSIAYSQEPTIDEIRTIATQFLHDRAASLSLVKKSVPDYDIENISRITQDRQGMYNVVEMIPEGFVMVSNDKAIDPVIAYSMKSEFEFSADTSNVLYHLIMEDIKLRNAFYSNVINQV